ncbi:MAG: LD-carboxypeptidase [Acidobacteria bacterium]|nr:LD-carboxypeptidase [Acidobacteriota bacterium]
MLKPPRLRAGDMVAIAAPASPIREEFLSRGVAEIESLGFRCVYEPGILSRERYLAGSDRRRADELTRYLNDPQVKAIISARGGYGSGRAIDLLTVTSLKSPKILCGYSDITALHLFFQQRAGWVTFYGPMAAWEFARGDRSYDRAAFMSAVTGEPQSFSGLRCVRQGPVVRGRTMGGCLSIIEAAAGTGMLPSFEGSILVLEDESVKPYQLDRMMVHLRRAEVLTGVRAIVFGEMPHCNQTEDQGYDLADVIADVTPEVPVLTGLAAGHAKRVTTLPLGIEAELDPAAGCMKLLESAVT